MLHPGHVKLLQSAANHCDVLYVYVNRDDYCTRRKGEGRPAQPLLERMEAVEKIAAGRMPCKTFVRVLMADDPRGVISRILPDVLILGEDYAGRDLPGVEYAQRVVFVPRIPNVSTTELIGSQQTQSAF